MRPADRLAHQRPQCLRQPERQRPEPGHQDERSRPAWKAVLSYGYSSVTLVLIGWEPLAGLLTLPL